MSSLLARLAALVSGGGRGSRAARTGSARQGLWGEREAEKFLLGRDTEDARVKVRVLGRRVKVGRDEIDLVLEERDARGREIVFVEVKTRSSELFGGGRAAMDRRKRHALCRAVARYMRRLPPTPFRIDLVEVYGRADSGAPPRIEHQRAAVPMELRYAAPALARRRI